MKELQILMLALLVQGCASASLSDKQRESIESVDVYFAVVQDEIHPIVDISNSAAIGYFAFGIIGGAIASDIDAGINEKRSRSEGESFESFWNTTLDIDYRLLAPEYLIGAVDRSFHLSGIPKKAEYAVLSDRELIEQVNALKENTAVIYLVPSYEFTNGYKRLRTALSVEIFRARSSRLDLKPRPVYKRTISYESQSFGDGGQDSLRFWEENGAILYREKLLDGLESVAKILAFDIGNLGKNCRGVGSVYTQDLETRDMMTIEGTPLNIANDLDAILSWSGFIYSFAKSEAEVGETLRVDC